jgi:hypothetical protein
VCVGGFGLNGFFSSEEHYARDLQGYYHALSLHPHHNYYFGRSEADLNSWPEVANPSRRARSRSLSAIYRQLIGNARGRGEERHHTPPNSPSSNNPPSPSSMIWAGLGDRRLLP